MSQLREGPRTVITHLYIQQMRTLKESWVESHPRGLPMPRSFCPLSPPPTARKGVLGRMTFVQLSAPPGCFRQGKVWGVARRCPPPSKGYFSQSQQGQEAEEAVQSHSRDATVWLRTGVWATPCLSVLNAPTHLELSTQDGDGMLHVSVCVLRKWTGMVWDGLASWVGSVQ